jgi:hypothetical protein
VLDIPAAAATALAEHPSKSAVFTLKSTDAGGTATALLHLGRLT